MQKEWKLKEKAPGEFFERVPAYSPQTLQLLWTRNLKTQQAIDEFFNPDYEEDLHDPFLYKGMAEAVERIMSAVKKKEKILVFGDYDHDGVSGAALLTLFFREIGIENEVYIPDRLKEGYGLSQNSIEKIISSGINVLITIDCGITDYDEIKKAKEAGIDVIVLDHHLVHGKLPPACVIIDAKQKGETYPFKELSGAGVAFKVVQALIRHDDIRVPEGWEKWLLDLVTISTVGDIVPLVGENRTLVKYGLVVLAQTRRPGIRALMEKAGLKPRLASKIDPKSKIPQTNLDTYSVGFMIVPRINAASRMDHADTAFALLTTESKEEAGMLAQRLEDHNKERQSTVEKITKEVEQRLRANEKIPPVIIEGDEGWSRGVLGIVANRILDKYFRPTFIFSKGKEKSVGSVRSTKGFNVVEAMESCKDLFEEFGGHKAAGGFTIKNENIEKFKEGITMFTNKNLGSDGFTPILEVEMELSTEDVNWELFEEIEKFGPFGEANPKPVFVMRNLEIAELRPVGQNGRHLQLLLQSASSDKQLRAIYFNGANGNGHLGPGDNIDTVFEFVADEWNGTKELKLKITDLRIAT